MELDGCFPDASEVLTDEEYFSKVGFKEDLLSTFNMYEKDGTYCWPINSRQGYIQKGRFRPDINDKTGRLEWAIIYERYPETPNTIYVNFGDLLAYISVVDRRRWKEHFKAIRAPPAHAEKLLFFENDEELKVIEEYWNGRIDDSDLPWFTAQQKEQVAKELHYLKQYDRENDEYRELRLLEFRREVLDKYRNNELCQVHDSYITFLRQDKRTSVKSSLF